MQISLKELADIVGGELSGNPDLQITGAADIADAEEGDIVFAESPKLLEAAVGSKATAVVAYAGAGDSGKAIVAVENPRFAFARILAVFSPVKERKIGIHQSAIIGEDTVIGEDPAIGAYVYIGRNTTIGKNVLVYPFVYIGDNVHIGDDCTLHPFTSILDRTELGDRVTVHNGAVIGSDGFGYTKVGGEHCKIPHIGHVVIGDDVEIGANSTIDRARNGTTEIGRGTKVDNLVQVAHNVKIGEKCILVAQVGISGSAIVGDDVVIAGQAGIRDHVTIGEGAILCARAGVIGNIEPGAFVSGYPARDHREQMRMHAAQVRLPAMLKTLKDLEKRIRDLEDRVK